MQIEDTGLGMVLFYLKSNQPQNHIIITASWALNICQGLDSLMVGTQSHIDAGIMNFPSSGGN